MTKIYPYLPQYCEVCGENLVARQEELADGQFFTYTVCPSCDYEEEDDV